MEKILWASIFLLSLVGCMSIDPTPFNGPNGKQSYSMQCNGMGRTMDACYQKAGEVCPAGYSIIERSSSMVGYMNQGIMMMRPREQLAIECK